MLIQVYCDPFEVRPCNPGMAMLNRLLSTPRKSSRGTRERRMARARRESFLPCAITEASGAHLRDGAEIVCGCLRRLS